ncbi:MAG: DinB family protein [Chitinophagales bacterium]
MKSEKFILHLQALLDKGFESINQISETTLSAKPSLNKWSKKEILGHLIDSGINNLQRFTEIQFNNQPYNIRKYNQNELVKVNHYQTSDTQEILNFWLAVNQRILFVMQQQTETSLNYKVVLSDGKMVDLFFLMEDYVLHLEHHLNQIIAS